MNWRIDKTRDGKWHEYHIFQDEDIVIYAKWKLHPDGNAELHNDIFKTSKSVLVEARRVFHEVVRPDMRNAGVQRIVVVNTKEAAAGKMVRYWSFMGFTYLCGIMEA